jgi:hypothetical protein
MAHADIEQGLDDYLQKQVDLRIPALDIIHGELKTMMLDAENELELALSEEERTGEAIDSMERRYCEGQIDALVAVYQLTYQLSFAIAEREDNATV